MRDDGPFSVHGASVLITGSSRGIGRELAAGFARAGAQVAINATRSHDEAEATALMIRNAGGDAIVVLGDVSDPEAVESITSATTRAFGKIDCLINNAGVNYREPATSATLENWRRVLSVNIEGAYLCARTVASACMIPRGQGSIVNISSISGLVGHPGVHQSAYQSSKAALIMLSRSLALEWAGYGIRVNALCPGFINTDLLADDFGDGSSARALAIQDTPMRRFGEPSELVGPAIFLASAASSFMTGQCLIADGGYTSW